MGLWLSRRYAEHGAGVFLRVVRDSVYLSGERPGDSDDRGRSEGLPMSDSVFDQTVVEPTFVCDEPTHVVRHRKSDVLNEVELIDRARTSVLSLAKAASSGSLGVHATLWDDSSWAGLGQEALTALAKMLTPLNPGAAQLAHAIVPD